MPRNNNTQDVHIIAPLDVILKKPADVFASKMVSSLKKLPLE